jgi:hypothetical protein
MRSRCPKTVRRRRFAAVDVTDGAGWSIGWMRRDGDPIDEIATVVEPSLT